MSKNRKQRVKAKRPDHLPPLRSAQEIFREAAGFHQAGRIDDAVALYRSVLLLRPDYAEAHNNLGAALAGHGNVDEAIAHFKRACALNPGYLDAQNNVGAALVRQGRIEEAVGHYRQMSAVNPGNIEAHDNLGKLFMYQGRFDDAAVHYRRAIAIQPDCAETHYNLAQIKTFSHGDADLAALEALARKDNLPADKRPFIHFALAKALDDCGERTRAFEQMRKGNELKRRQIRYDEPSAIMLLKRTSAVFDRTLIDRFRGAGHPSSAPIFVLGMPRSGSSLIEQILASHPEIHAAGELNDLEMALLSVLNTSHQPIDYPECVPAMDDVTLRRIGQSYLARLPAPADGKVRIVDKSPGNFPLIGLIRLVLPHARIIHTTRDPIDTCMSCYSKLFTTGHQYSYDLGELGRFYHSYRELMAHWRSVLPPDAMLDVDYADVVDDLEGQARRLIAYCGLPWDDRCLNFHETARPIRTASAVQVRKPLFRSSLQRWRKYEADLGPLLREFGDIIHFSD